MSENKITFIWIGAFFGIAIVLWGIVWAHDQGVVDHLFDFHLDTERAREQIEREIEQERHKAEVDKEWERDLFGWMKQDG